MRVFDNTICRGVFVTPEGANAGVYQLQCAFYRDDLHTIETTCEVVYEKTVNTYTYMLIWNIAMTVGFVGCAFAALFLVWLRRKGQWGVFLNFIHLTPFQHCLFYRKETVAGRSIC